MPEATAILKKFNMLKIGISLKEQEKMSAKEKMIWHLVAENNDRYLRKKKLELENIARMR